MDGLKKEGGGIVISRMVFQFATEVSSFMRPRATLAMRARGVGLCRNEWTPPTNEDWKNRSNYWLPHIRMAWLTMYKTKDELETVCRELDRDFAFMIEGF